MGQAAGGQPGHGIFPQHRAGAAGTIDDGAVFADIVELVRLPGEKPTQALVLPPAGGAEEDALLQKPIHLPEDLRVDAAGTV